MNKFKIVAYGFLSGYIYCFLTITLQAVFATLGYDISFISSLVFALLPYSFKFLWSGFADSVKKENIDYLISFFALLICLSFIVLIFFSKITMLIFMLMLFNIAFLGACFDILTDLNLIKNFSDEKRPFFLSYYIGGWRLSSIFAGGAVLFIFNNLFDKNIDFLFLFSSFIFFIFLNIFNFTTIKKFLAFILKNKLYFFLIIPCTSFLFILKTSFTNFKESLIIFLNLKEFYVYSLFYKLFDLTLSSFVVVFFIKELKLSIEFFGIINTIVPLLSILILSHLWKFTSKIFSLKEIMLYSLLIKSITIIIFMLLNFLSLNINLFLLIAFILNVFSSSFITYTYSNYIMQSVQGDNSSFKYSILSSLPMLFLVVSVPFSSILISKYNWNIFFFFILFLQIFSYLSINNIELKKNK
ncbi:hypothetical protein ABLB96_11375 [Acinetobacter sp. XH1741]|uniref:hypothetical protein n=1 Tax=unclassified Acinetobacter TaxID=196816 RepID=UPI0032B57808